MVKKILSPPPANPGGIGGCGPDSVHQVPQEMRALVMNGVDFAQLQVRKVPTPRIGPRQLLARVDAAGICTSLIKLVEQGPDHKLIYGWDIARYPLILGDEGSVTLVKVGAELGGSYQAGQRYVLQPAVDHAPINHRERYRDNARGIEKVAVGYTLAGHLAEYMLIPEEVLAAGCLVPLPRADLPYSHASMAEPFSCVISAQDHHQHLTQDSPLSPRKVLKGLKPGGVTVVIGAGAMGRMHVDLAMSYRPRAIVVTDINEQRLQLVKNLFEARSKQLVIALHTSSPEVKDLVGKLTEYRGADDVIVAVGSGKAIEEAQLLTGRGAVLNLFGGMKKGEDVVRLDTGIVHYREINVTGSSGGSPWDVAQTLDLMAAGEINAGGHITRVGDLEHAVDFLKMIKAQDIDGKAIVYPHRRSSRIRAVASWGPQDEQIYLRESEA